MARMTKLKLRGEVGQAIWLRFSCKVVPSLLLLIALATFPLLGPTSRKTDLPEPPQPSSAPVAPKDDRGKQPLDTNVSEQIQLSHYTFSNRHPSQFACAAKHVLSRETDEAPTKLLSFGCSKGREASTLGKKYFPQTNVKVFGVDLDQVVLEKARRYVRDDNNDGKYLFFNGRITPISQHGPYDAIFANSVLASSRRDKKMNLHPDDQNVTKLVTETFPFEKFQSLLHQLDEVLVVGGVLELVSTNYDFAETDLAHRYRPISCDCSDNWTVNVVDREKMVYKDIVNHPEQLPHCIWVKESE